MARCAGVITHDRYFLDSVCNRIVEVDKGAIYSYETNYSGYLERKAEREESAEASERKRQSVLRKELEWVRRGAKARTTKQKGRLQRYEGTQESEGAGVRQPGGDEFRLFQNGKNHDRAGSHYQGI